MAKTLDKNITTLTDFRFATEALTGELQMYIQVSSANADLSALIEVTELQVNLAKNKDDEAFLVLRCT